MCPQYTPLLLPVGNLRVGYREVALGGGAIFFRFYTKAPRVVLSDTNAELIGTYEMVRDNPKPLLAVLERHQRAFDEAVASANYDGYREVYFALRTLMPADLEPIERAARMITLNKTCNNGLYRVNAAGVFNVSPGKQESPDGTLRVPRLVKPARLMACSRVLEGAALRVADMRLMLEEARSGELVIVDPPYVPISETANFTGYSARGFSLADQHELAASVTAAAARGVMVALSNSDTKLTRELYGRFDIQTIVAPRSISRDGDTRHPVLEILVRTWI